MTVNTDMTARSVTNLTEMTASTEERMTKKQLLLQLGARLSR